MNDERLLALHAAASSSLREFFALLQHQTEQFPDHAETLVRKARIVLAFRVEDLQEEHEIDLKTGPMPRFSSNTKFSPTDSAFDLVLSIDTKQRFLDLMTQREDGMKAYSAGSVKLVKGSMRVLLKLRSLQELAERWKQDLQLSSSSAQQPQPQAEGEGEDKVMQGYVEKQSDWLKRWHSRYLVLRWNDHSKPQLRIYASQAEARARGNARHFFELHSGVAFAKTRGAPLVLSLVDTRRNNALMCTLQFASERSMREWQTALETSVQARAMAVEEARKRLLEGGEDAQANGGLLDLLLATQRVCTKHAQELQANAERNKTTQEQIIALQGKAQDADDFLIYSTLESDWTTLRKHLGWYTAPLCLVAAAGLKLTWSRLITPMLHLSAQRALAVAALLCAMGYYLAESEHASLIRRRARVYALSLVVIWRLKLSSLKSAHLPPLHAQAMWNVEFRTNAERLYLLALELRGLWVKSAQFLGARPDIMPDQALFVLKRLHDDVPPTPFEEIKPLVERELGGELHTLFDTFDQNALASASIGQVHVAHMSKTKAKAVVKVQHPNIEGKITQDLVNMEQIVRLVEVIEPDFQGRDLVEEWSREVGKELDFEQEARNMLEVGANLAKHPEEIHACIPLPLAYTKRALVMRFVTGAKVNDLDVLRRVSGVETDEQRVALAEDICHAYAHQIFLDGLFQADAHPGNVLVARRADLDPTSVQFLPPGDRAIPVLLDFGLTKRLSARKRLAFSRMICAMQNMDISQLLLSFEEMGLRLKREDPLEDLEEVRFAFRETADAKQSREEMMKHVQQARVKYESRSREERNPVEAFPPELMLFFRTIFLLRGLCTSLQVQVKYLRIMAQWAKRALLEEKAEEEEEEEQQQHSTLQEKIAARVRELKYVGVQICAISAGNKEGVAEETLLCLGQMHELETTRVTKDTLFPCLGLGQGVAQIALRSTSVGDELVRNVWPQFARGEDTLTVDDLLRARNLGFSPSAVPSKFFVASMHKWEDHLSFLEQPLEYAASAAGATPIPWELSALNYSWGWALVGLMQKQAQNVAGVCAYERFVNVELGSKLGVEGSLLARAPESDLPPPASKKGALSEAEEDAREEQRRAVNAKYAKLTIDLDRLSGGAIDLDKMMNASASDASSSQQPAALAGFDIQSILGSLDISLKGKEYLVDPRIMNSPSARSSVSPSCNLLATATSLARLYFALGCNAGRWEAEQILPEHVSHFYCNQAEQALLDEPLSDTLGIKQFEFKHRNNKETVRGFGQVAFGGSLVLCVPKLRLSLCVLVNDLTLERDVTRAVVEEICHHYGLELVSEI